MQKIDIKKHQDQTEHIPASGSWPETHHIFDRRSLMALQAALHAGRPLLIRGEPGTGKSQLARAAAHILEREFISEVVNARSESQDLLWHFDAIARLGEAQALGSAHSGNVGDKLNTRKFLSPGALWWAFNWEDAQKKFDDCDHNPRCKPFTGEAPKPNGWVVLIDEIDKADADLPNGLLETLGNRAFKVPYIDEAVVAEKNNAPLVIITTNGERELPPAFLRRCLVLQLSLPKEDGELAAWLITHAKVHVKEKIPDNEVLEEAAKQLIKDRKNAEKEGEIKPGQAEYIDLINALVEISSNTDEQLSLLKEIKEFVLVKHGR